MQNAAFCSERTVVCPKPRRIGLFDDHHHSPHRPLRWQISHQLELSESQSELDILDIILTEDGYDAEIVDTPLASSSPFFCGSPPSRVSNPITQDERFRDELNITPVSPIQPPSGLPVSPSPSPRSGSCIRGGFSGSPMVRIEGFDCLDRDRRNCSIPALA